ncbi:MAG: hypothetical protein ACLFV0_12175, partial [Nitriliruptoraceae bacterium]
MTLTPEAYASLTVADVTALLDSGTVAAEHVRDLELARTAGPRKGVLRALERAGSSTAPAPQLTSSAATAATEYCTAASLPLL